LDFSAHGLTKTEYRHAQLIQQAQGELQLMCNRSSRRGRSDKMKYTSKKPAWHNAIETSLVERLRQKGSSCFYGTLSNEEKATQMCGRNCRPWQMYSSFRTHWGSLYQNLN